MALIPAKNKKDNRKKGVFAFLATIKAKLYFSVFLTVLSLFLVTGTAFYEAQKMTEAGEGIYDVSLRGVQSAGHIKSYSLIVKGLISRAPSELDLDKVQQLQTQTHKNIKDILVYIEEYQNTVSDEGQMTAILIMDIFESMKISGDKIFEFAGLFAADQAVEELQTNFKDLEEQMAQQIATLIAYEERRAEDGFNELLYARDAMFLIISIICLSAFLLAGGYSFLVAGNISKRTSRLTDVMMALAEGDVSQDISYTGDSDEIGNMARAVEVFKENKIEADRLNLEQEEQRKSQLARVELVSDLTANFDEGTTDSLSGLEDATYDLQKTAEKMLSIVETTKGRTQSISLAAERSANNTSSVAAATEEMTASIDEIAQQSRQSSVISQEAVSGVQDAVAQISALAETSTQINEVIVLIRDIAEQTNLLALNATIEAARAGDAGKGFAVVASEVKGLANETAEATNSIAKQIEEIQEQTTSAVSSVNNVSGKISDVEQILATIAAAVEEQSSATKEISRNVQQAAEGAKGISNDVQEVADSAESVRSEAQAVLGSSEGLSKQGMTLSEDISQFINAIKKA